VRGVDPARSAATTGRGPAAVRDAATAAALFGRAVVAAARGFGAGVGRALLRVFFVALVTAAVPAAFDSGRRCSIFSRETGVGA